MLSLVSLSLYPFSMAAIQIRLLSAERYAILELVYKPVNPSVNGYHLDFRGILDKIIIVLTIPLLLILPTKSTKQIFRTKAYIPTLKAAVSRPFLKFRQLQILKQVSKLLNILLGQERFIQELNGYMNVNNSCLSGREK